MSKKSIMGATMLVLSAAWLTPVVAQTPAAEGQSKISQPQCETLWKQALGGSSGDLTMDKAKPYVKDFKQADKNTDSKLSQSEWSNACGQGWIKSASAGEYGNSGATSDRTPEKATERTPGAGSAGAAGTDGAKTTGGTSDRSPKQ